LLLHFFSGCCIYLKTTNFDSRLIFNFDEVSLNQSPSSTQSVVSVLDDVDEYESTNPGIKAATLLLLTGADGYRGKSVVLIPQVNIPEEFEQRQTKEIVFYAEPPKGWMTRVRFEYIFEHDIIPEINERRRIARIPMNVPALIYTDGHNSRGSPTVFQLALANNIVIVCIPPHLSHILQPNDRGVNAVFKQALAYYAVLQFEESESEHRINFFNRLKNALENSLKSTVIQAAWANSGLFPLNPLRIIAVRNILTPLLAMPRFLSYLARKSSSIALGGHVLTDPRSSSSFENLHKHVSKDAKVIPAYRERLQMQESQVNLIKRLIDGLGHSDNEEHDKVSLEGFHSCVVFYFF
jgi:hypothetical protein